MRWCLLAVWLSAALRLPTVSALLVVLVLLLRMGLTPPAENSARTVGGTARTYKQKHVSCKLTAKHSAV
jgi:hypothetical protein